MNQTLIRESRVSLRDFILQNLDTPSRPQPCFFSSFYFFEPLLVEEPLGGSPPAPSLPSNRLPHPFKIFFPGRRLLYCPRVLVLQSRKPFFGIMRALLEFLYKSVFEPYVRGTSPLTIKPRIANIITKKPNASILKFKEFVYSVVLSLRLPSAKRFSLGLSLKKHELVLDACRHFGQACQRQAVEFCLGLIRDPERRTVLIELFFQLLLERPCLVVCAHAASLYSLLMMIIAP